MTFELQGLAIQVAGPPSDRWVPSDCHIPIYNSNTVLHTLHSMLLINNVIHFFCFISGTLLEPRWYHAGLALRVGSYLG